MLQGNKIVVLLTCNVVWFTVVCLFENYFLKSFSSRLSEWTNPEISVNSKKIINENYTIRSLNSYSKSYINHLINTNEILGSMILTLNNIVFYQELMQKIREAIKNNTFDVFYKKYIDLI